MDTECANDIKAIRKSIEKNHEISKWIGILTVLFVMSLIGYDQFFKDNFCKDAGELFEKGKYTELRILAEKRKSTHPNDPYIYWYLARAEYLDGNKKVAVENLEHLKLISPSWNDGYIKPMQEAIQQQNK